MISKEVLINNESGLESKKAALFIQRASNYKSSIWIEMGERKANAKSLLGMLSLKIPNGTKVNLIIEGDDEEEAIKSLEEFLADGMEERA